ncbi:PREDICTED: uncharacterized protein LOC104599411 [Nelumbo nucifera]|uniref:Uncharacterized protein LOC104599411 n=2 Tax=Nelumbo nucifera TaxID=4432 RepID=A0A1U8Q6I2_NELNU|nr:PREDICTED: uncharacterized protein LOC104599411 [Nelumbo nucifera]XP_019053675.1 PREDICTED: uncharacterized protein LOC104599411 [Nelumbo nucifera]DAD22857.1 TPA_asm: hypothetical protein HUJ06_024320 [Nelumbo nucifera]
MFIVNGEVGFVDNIDSDRICYLDIVDDFCKVGGIPLGSLVTINYKIPRWELEDQIGLLGCENDMLVMFAIHGDLHEIVFYVTYIEAKCVSIDDMCSIQNVEVGDHGKGKGKIEDDEDCCVVEYVLDDDVQWDGFEGGVADREQDYGDGNGLEAKGDVADEEQDFDEGFEGEGDGLVHDDGASGDAEGVVDGG